MSGDAGETLSPSSTCSTDSAGSSPFRRSRFEHQTRREAMERRFGKSAARFPIKKDDEKKEDYLEQRYRSPQAETTTTTPVISNRTGVEEKLHATPLEERRIDEHPRPIKQLRSFPPSFKNQNVEAKRDSGNSTVTTATASSATHPATQQGYMALSDETSEGESHHETSSPPNLPQHLIESNEPVYYRVVYRGVVSLLSAPDGQAPRSGSYLSYGEIFCSRYEVPVVDSDSTVGSTLSPRPRILDSDEPIKGSPTQSVFSRTGGFVSSMDTSKTTLTVPPLHNPALSCPEDQLTIENTSNRVIRVDRVLTGGYAMDALDGSESGAETPKKSNTHHLALVGPEKDHLGFLFARRKDLLVVESISTTPKAEEGKFLYKIMSSTPLPILTGPSFDAPKTKALVLPGTIHEISLRVSVDPDGEGVWFLRMSHRRGWIADRKVSTRAGKPVQSVPVVKEVSTDDQGLDDGSVSALSSIAASSVTAPGYAARRRHRPPRRSDATDQSMDKMLPRQIGAKVAVTPVKSTKAGLNETAASDKLMTPSSNVSILSDDSSMDQNASGRHATMPESPDISHGTTKSAVSASSGTSIFLLMRVSAPRGLKILDAPQFQVNNLIHGKHGSANVSSSHMISKLESNMGPPKSHHSIFQTMSGRLTTTGPSKTGNPAVFDASSKTRVLPRGALFEASKRMESTGAYSQGAGLIKLSDFSGWAIVPRQDELDQQYRNYTGGVAGIREGEATRAYEEVGNAVLDPSSCDSSHVARSIWIRVVARAGLPVSCPPPVVPINDDDTSPTSSRDESSAISGSNHGSSFGPLTSHDSDVASSVGSAFLDAMFRTPKKNKKESEASQEPPARQHASIEKQLQANTIPCGMCIEVEKWADTSLERNASQEYARLRGGQGWLPLVVSGKPASTQVARPEFRFGSFWFRVQSARGIKVRLGPSRKAPSIKSEDGVYFRFECGEFLRASEIMTIFSEEGDPVECFAKLYRNRHVRLHVGHEEFRQLPSLTMQAEWVQIYNQNELYLEECAEEPRIERHKQGWRYNVVPDSGVAVRRGPSFAAEKTGTILFGGESVVVNERVSPAGDKLTWLRMKDGQGWVHDVDDSGERIMIAHSLRHRANLLGRPHKPAAPKDGKDIAYNAIIARLFHNDMPGEAFRQPKDLKELRR